MENINLVNATDSTSGQNKKKYKFKRTTGTIGVTGPLYETKLFSLILYRALRDEDVKEFWLGLNVANIGAFDDICLKFELEKKWVSAFIQLKHKYEPRKGGITDNDLKTDSGNFSLKKYFQSYNKIKEEFESENKTDKTDHMFAENMKETECCLIIYTSAVSKITKRKNTQPNIQVNKIRELISTCDDDDVFQIKYDDEEINELANFLIDKQLNLIARAMMDCVVSDIKNPTESKEVIKKYQSFLIPNVICQDDSEKWKVNDKIMFSNNYLCIKLREILCNDLLLLKSLKIEEDAEKNLVALIESEIVDVKQLSKVIGAIVIFNRQTLELELTKNVPVNLEKYRNKVNNLRISQALIREASHQASENVLLAVRFKLPQELNNSINVLINTGLGCSNQSLKDSIFNEQRNIARQFLNNLYFYTKEPKQDKIEKVLIKELRNSDNSYSKHTFSEVHAKALFLKFHDKIQKWSTLTGNVDYRTKRCDFLEKSKIELMNYHTYLTTLDFNFTSEIKKYALEFRNTTVDNLKMKLDSSSLKITIFTDIVLLTSVKLFQCLKKDKCSFINFDAIMNLTFDELQILLEEIRTAGLDILVIVVKYEIEEFQIKSLESIISKFPKKLVVVSNQNGLTMHLKSKLNFDNLSDTEINFVDLDEGYQKQLLDCKNEACHKIITQGQEVPLGLVIDDSSKHLIRGEVLLMILRNKKIVIGKNLIDAKYASIQKFFIPRRLQPLVYNYYLQDNIIIQSPMIITAEAGMGKSTQLSYMSVETKIHYPKIWIVRINLIDYSPEFKRWQNEQKYINLKDTMTLVCKTELVNAKGSFELDDSDGLLEIKYCDMTGPALLHLEFIIHSYNNNTMVFFFDGFDEICPHFQNEGVKFIKTFVHSKKHINPRVTEKLQCVTQKKLRIWKIWITSRPYNSITRILEREFAKTCQFKPWSSYEQQIFCQKYFESNINLDKISPEQFENIESFFGYMSQFRRIYQQDGKVLHVNNIPLHSVYQNAVDYFRYAILQASLNIDKEELRNKWVSINDLLTVLERCHVNMSEIKKAMQLAGTPLHMFIAANCFLNGIIKTTNQKETHEKWDLKMNTFEYYEIFLETKLKIRLNEKNKRHTSYPDEMISYEKEKKEFTESHKTLAFYALFHHNKQYFRNIVSKKELTLMKEKIRQIEKGEEKNGLIHRIHDNVPRFIHLVFAEYFAVEYISDKIKSSNKALKRKRLDFIVNCLLLSGSIGLMTVFNDKLQYDKEFTKSLSDLESNYVFQLLLEQTERIEYDMYDDVHNERHNQSSLYKSLSNRLNNIVMFLLSGLNEGNLYRFVEFAENFILSAASLDQDNIIIFVLNKLRTLDPVIVSELLNRTELRGYLNAEGGLMSDEEIFVKIYENGFKIPTCFYNPDE